ncbi:SdpI family protein [Ruminococcus sp.]|uniref:SdpI family protein n=1 Tax=Ruminococcus sp. TaxID=41978 RepID=UPI0025F35ABC|nr:SdpI family protein [Ruminococcus sp.]
MLVFYIAMTIFIPLLMLLSGWVMKYHTPKNINGFIGYRTERSMRSQETWNFAHQYCGRLWITIGTGMLIVSAVLCVGYAFFSEKAGYIVFLVAILMQTLLLLLTIPPTEYALQKNFDSNGHRKTNEVK